MIPTRSFRFQLASRFTGTMALGILAISVFSLWALKVILDRELNATVMNVASIQASSVTESPTGEMRFHEWDLTPREATSVQELVRWAQVWRADGRSLLRSQYMTGDLPTDSVALARSAAGEIVWREDGFQGAEIRSVYYPLERMGPAHERHILQVAAPLEGRNQMLARAVLFFGGLFLVVTVGSFAGSWWLAGRVVRPVHEITDQAEEIGAGSLKRRISAYADLQEYQRLVQVLNTMLERLQRAFESQRRFTADASHELRSPLTAMRGELEVALRRERGAEEYRRVIASTLEEAVRLQRITEDLLTLARSDAGVMKPGFQWVDVAELARSTVARLERVAAEKGVELTVEEEGDPHAAADPNLVGQAIWNLVDNALRFGASGDAVTVTVGTGEEDLEIRVEDTGPGFDQDPGRVFERFYREDPSRSHAGEDSGTGLGLAIVKSVVQAHGGEIRAENRDDGGARVTLRLPRRSRKDLSDLHAG